MAPEASTFAEIVVPSFALGAAAMRLYMKGPLHDEGHTTYITPSPEALQAIIDIYTENGLVPSRRIEDEEVLQAVMKDNHTVFLNVLDDRIQEELGQPTAAPMMPVKNPEQAAIKAAETLKKQGFEAEVVSPMEGQAKGKIFFVKTNALGCGLLGFRRHVLKMGSRPPKWDRSRRLGTFGIESV